MYIPRVKTIFLSVIILTLFVLVNPFQISFESEYTSSESAGTPVLTFRDITDFSAAPDPVVSLDKSNYGIGETATITVTDTNADVNTGAVDFTSATVTMTSSTDVTLTETGSNTGVFTGTFTVDDDPSVDYTGNSPQATRASITLPLATAGDVTLSDVGITNDSNLATAGVLANIDAVDITLSGGATFTSVPTVVLSYANANFSAAQIAIPCPGGTPPCPERTLALWHKAPGQFWEEITKSCNQRIALSLPCFTFLNTGAQTITSDPNGPGFDFTDGQGEYSLVQFVGPGGGGGGGLVRPGLVVNALAGLGSSGGGGGGGPPGPTITLHALALNDNAVETISMPQEIRDIVLVHDPLTPLEPITTIFEDYDLPLSINGNGFALGDYENTLVTQTVETGELTEFNLVFYTTSEIAHTSLYFNLGPTRAIAGSDTQVLLYKDKPAEIVDPNGNIASATGSINNEEDLKRVVTFSITFSDDIQWSNSDLVIRAWNDKLSSGDTIVYDAIEIAQPEIVEIADEDIPEPEIQTLKSQYVPIWIKNNAAWWSQELIEDSDFVAGIEYLIQNEIITIQDDQIIASYSSNEIPVWIKNNAGWWSEDLITEKEFIDGLQWLVSNGIIQVTET